MAVGFILRVTLVLIQTLQKYYVYWTVHRLDS